MAVETAFRSCQQKMREDIQSMAMMNRVAIAGLGPRGMAHLRGFLENPERFEVVGISDLVNEKVAAAIAEFGEIPAFADARTMLEATRPDVFCFCTPPSVRLSLARLAVEFGVRGVAMEKPLAVSLSEARQLRDLLDGAGIRTVVCLQHKYLKQMRRLQMVVESGALGELNTIEASCRSWLSVVGVHYIDYALWIAGNRRATRVCGHVHGTGKLDNPHPSPDYVLGHWTLDNGCRVCFQSGIDAPDYVPGKLHTNSRLTCHGTHGYAWADTEGGWGTLNRETGGVLVESRDPGWPEQWPELQKPYSADFADWLDDKSRVHPCNLAQAYHGFEIATAMYLSALENRVVDLPLAELPEEPLVERMRRELPEEPKQ
jgi:predicted dehydrogenase